MTNRQPPPSSEGPAVGDAAHPIAPPVDTGQQRQPIAPPVGTGQQRQPIAPPVGPEAGKPSRPEPSPAPPSSGPSDRGPLWWQRGPKPSAEGQLQKTPLVHLLIYAVDQPLTGTLLLIGPDQSANAIYLDGGVPAKVRTAGTVSPLDRVLVDLGMVSQANLQHSLLTVSKSGQLHGEYLLGKDWLEEDDLEAALTWQLMRKVNHLLTLPPETSYAFVDGANLIADYGGPELTRFEPLALIMSGVRRMANLAVIDQTLARLGDTPLRVARDAPTRRLLLRAQEEKVIDLLLARPATLRDLIASRIAQERVVKLTVYAMLVTRSLALSANQRAPVGHELEPVPFPGDHPDRMSTLPIPLGPNPGSLLPPEPPASGGQPPQTVPSAPQPSAPQPPAPQPSAPQPSAPQPSAPQPSAPQPSAPQAPAPPAPQPPAPQASTPQPPAPQPPAPQAPAPQAPAHAAPRPPSPRPPASAPEPRPKAPQPPSPPRTPSPPQPPQPARPPAQVAPSRAPQRSAPSPEAAATRGPASSRGRGGDSPPAAASPPGRKKLDRGEIVERLAALDQQTHYELLGVAESAASGEIRAKYFQLAKKWHPDRLPGEVVDLKSGVAKVFARMTEAHKVLSDPQKREEYNLSREEGDAAEEQEAVDRAVEAGFQHQKAEVFFKKGDYVTAENLMAEAVAADPEQPQYRAFLAWARAHRNPAPEGASSEEQLEHYADLLQMLHEVIDQDPKYEMGWYYRGQLLHRCGRASQAFADFRRVVKLNPRNIDAARFVRVHEMREQKLREGGGEKKGARGGLLGRWFK